MSLIQTLVWFCPFIYLGESQIVNFLLLHNKSSQTMRLKTVLAYIITCLSIICGFESLAWFIRVLLGSHEAMMWVLARLSSHLEVQLLLPSSFRLFEKFISLHSSLTEGPGFSLAVSWMPSGLRWHLQIPDSLHREFIPWLVASSSL